MLIFEEKKSTFDTGFDLPHGKLISKPNPHLAKWVSFNNQSQLSPTEEAEASTNFEILVKIKLCLFGLGQKIRVAT